MVTPVTKVTLCFEYEVGRRTHHAKYEFETEKERDAFLFGVKESCGRAWSGFFVIPENEFDPDMADGVILGDD